MLVGVGSLCRKEEYLVLVRMTYIVYPCRPAVVYCIFISSYCRRSACISCSDSDMPMPMKLVHEPVAFMYAAVVGNACPVV